MSQLQKSFGLNLRRIRLEQRLTQQELGERAGIDGDSITMIEGARYNVTVTIVERLATALDAPPALLLAHPLDRLDDRDGNSPQFPAGVRPLDLGIGRRICEHREKRGMSREMLAVELGRTVGEIEDYESGRRTAEPVLLLILATVLETRISAFFAESGAAASCESPSADGGQPQPAACGADP